MPRPSQTRPAGSNPPMQYYYARRNLDFSSPASSPLESPIYGAVSPDEHLDAKVKLRNRLNSGHLANMPAGFPFRHVTDPCGAPRICYDPYEFREDLRLDSRRGKLAAYVSFINESADTRPYSSKKDYLSWCAYLPQLDLLPYTRGPPREFPPPIALFEYCVLSNTVPSKTPRCTRACRCPSDEHSVRKTH
jgi:hypothetical protein